MYSTRQFKVIIKFWPIAELCFCPRNLFCEKHERFGLRKYKYDGKNGHILYNIYVYFVQVREYNLFILFMKINFA